MDTHIETLAIIPARGGSNGIPEKNIQDLCGTPLVAYSILAAKKCKRISRIVVSTDSTKIAEIALLHGAEVPSLRPPDISGSKALIGDAISHTLQSLANEEYTPDAVVELFPTHPFRPKGMLETLLCKLEQGYSQAYTARPIIPIHQRYCTMNSEGSIRMLTPKIPELSTRATAWRRYGLASAYTLTPNMLGTWVESITDPYSLIDIDEPEDLELARLVIDRELFNFGFKSHQ